MRAIHQQQATCGLQICQHPLCWQTNRQAIRGLLLEQQRHKGADTPKKDKSFIDRITPMHVDDDDTESEDIAFGLPTLTIFNMIDDYGVSTRDIIASETVKMDRALRKEGTQTEDIQKTSQIPKLGLKSLASMSTDDVTAPANTPLHSCHEFEGTDCYSSDADKGGQRRFKTHKQNRINTERLESTPHKYGKVLLRIGDSNVKGTSPKKVLVWCPSLKSKRQQVLENIRTKQSSMKRVDLPLNSVPAYNLTLMSHKAIKGMVCKKNRQSNIAKVKGPQPGQASRITPQEIELLRRVPIDVLIRVLNQAEENKVITKKQSKYLLAQVGRKAQLPPIVKKNAAEIPPCTNNEEIDGEEKPKTPAKSNAIKILDLAYSQTTNERTVSAGPGIREDALAVVRASDLNPSRTAPPSTRAIAEDSQYDKKLRSIADENLQPIVDERTRRKRTPVKYIATLYDENIPMSSVKPFHYKQSTRDIFLGPVPSPPPPSPPTERDSLYDPQIGGSTVLVNPSLNELSTIASFDEKKLSPRLSKTPLSAMDDDIRNAKMTQTSRSQIHDIPVISPFNSSLGGEGWPQVNEDDFLEAAQSSDYMNSPIPSFIENEVRSLPRQDSVELTNENAETNKNFPNIPRDELVSPVPPPPSPEPVSGNKLPEQDTPTETRRTMGAATALGLVGLPKKTSLETTPETEPGIPPTPVISSVKSDEGMHSRGATASIATDRMTITETPFENEEDNDAKEIIDVKTENPIVDETNFEENISPDVARAELEEEVKKLDIS